MGLGLSELKDVLGDKAVAVVPSAEKAKPTTAAPSTKEDKFKALEAVTKSLNAQFKTTNSLVRLGKKVGVPVPSYATGVATLDYEVFGCGGAPKGRHVELFGPESGGKTTLGLQILAADQARGGIVAVVDAEHALDPNYASQLGVNVDELLVSQPDNGEQALETVEALIDSQCVSIILVDSVSALVPQAEIDGEMGDAQMGLQARLMSQAMRKLTAKAGKYGVTVLWINQVREKIGVMYGNPETTTGGRALKFYASVRLDVRRTGGNEGLIKSGNNVIGHQMKIRNVKNKVATPLRETIVDLIYGQGIDKFADMVGFAKRAGVLQQAGAWYKFNGENVGNGMDKTVLALRDNPELMGKIRSEVEKALAAQREADKA